MPGVNRMIPMPATSRKTKYYTPPIDCKPTLSGVVLPFLDVARMPREPAPLVAPRSGDDATCKTAIVW